MIATGGCHCGAVRFRVDVHTPVTLLICNCSICRKIGYEHLIVPEADFELLDGADALESYTFGTHTAEHLFCRKCGVKSFYRPRSHPDGWSVNFRCLDDPDSTPANRTDFDGRNWETARRKLG